MYLNRLNKLEKEAFINIAKIVANIDGEYHIKERVLIHNYIKEVDLEEANIQAMSFDESIAIFQDSSFNSKRILLFEILALAYADNKFQEEEQILIEKIIKLLEIPNNEYQTLFEHTKNINESMQCVFKTIFQ